MQQNCREVSFNSYKYLHTSTTDSPILFASVLTGYFGPSFLDQQTVS